MISNLFLSVSVDKKRKIRKLRSNAITYTKQKLQQNLVK